MISTGPYKGILFLGKNVGFDTQFYSNGFIPFNDCSQNNDEEYTAHAIVISYLKKEGKSIILGGINSWSNWGIHNLGLFYIKFTYKNDQEEILEMACCSLKQHSDKIIFEDSHNESSLSLTMHYQIEQNINENNYNTPKSKSFGNKESQTQLHQKIQFQNIFGEVYFILKEPKKNKLSLLDYPLLYKLEDLQEIKKMDLNNDETLYIIVFFSLKSNTNVLLPPSLHELAKNLQNQFIQYKEYISKNINKLGKIKSNNSCLFGCNDKSIDFLISSNIDAAIQSLAKKSKNLYELTNS